MINGNWSFAHIDELLEENRFCCDDRRKKENFPPPANKNQIAGSFSSVITPFRGAMFTTIHLAAARRGCKRPTFCAIFKNRVHQQRNITTTKRRLKCFRSPCSSLGMSWLQDRVITTNFSLSFVVVNSSKQCLFSDNDKSFGWIT